MRDAKRRMLDKYPVPNFQGKKGRKTNVQYRMSHVQGRSAWQCQLLLPPWTFLVGYWIFILSLQPFLTPQVHSLPPSPDPMIALRRALLPSSPVVVGSLSRDRWFRPIFPKSQIPSPRSRLSEFRIPNSEFQISNSEFRIPNFSSYTLPSRYSRMARTALPRWLRRSFSALSALPKVRPRSGWMKRGS